jgi:hypothetical protein
MNKDVRKLVMHDSLAEIAAAVAVDTGEPVVTVLFDAPDGAVEGRTMRPYSIERIRESLGRFVVKGEVVDGPTPDEDIVLSIDPFAEDGSSGSVELIHKNTPVI